MTVTVTRASIFDLSALSGAMSVLEWRVAKEIWRYGEVYAVHAETGWGEKPLIALAYLYPLPDGDAEGGFNPSSVDDAERGLGKAAPHMLGILRAIRLTLRNSPYRAIVTECRTEAGARLARAAGFNPSGVHGVVGEIWAYGHADRGKRPPPDAGAETAGRPVRLEPAAIAGADVARAGRARPGRRARR